MAIRKRPRTEEEIATAGQNAAGWAICEFANGRCECKDNRRERLCQRTEVVASRVVGYVEQMNEARRNIH